MHTLCLITGAVGGLGKAFAAECAGRGWDLMLTDLSAERLALLAGGLERACGVEVRYHPADLTNPISRAHLLEMIHSEGLRFRGLVNVAGLDHEGFFMERGSDEIQGILRLNVESTLLLTHSLLAYRDNAVPFRIINVSSLGAYFSMPIKATYAASKRFLLDFSIALRNELREENVTVTVLCPAGLPTNQACIDAIEAQGLGGQLTTENIGSVAYEAVEAAVHGRPIVVPGFLNRMLIWFGGLVPATSVAEVVGSRWRAAQRKRIET
jgi:short-subunit dehydrogenase